MAEATALTKVERVTLSLSYDEAVAVRDALQTAHGDIDDVWQALHTLLGGGSTSDQCGDATADLVFRFDVSLPHRWFVPDNLPWRMRNVLKREVAARIGLSASDVNVRVTFPEGQQLTLGG